MSNRVHISKKYKIKSNEMSKARIHLTKSLDALIYFYPPPSRKQSGKSKSNKQFFASNVEIERLNNDKIENQENMEIEWIWKCDKNVKKQTCDITNCITTTSGNNNNRNNKSIGFEDLFTKNAIINNGNIIRIELNMNNNNNNNKLINNTNRFKQKKSKKNTVKQTKINDFFHRENINNKNRSYNTKQGMMKQCTKNKFYNDWNLSYENVLQIMKETSNILNEETLFDIMPSIDCFAERDNYQKICKLYITKSDNFFDFKYNDIYFWSDKVAWCNPPNAKSTIIRCLNMLRPRQMRGYVVIPYYDQKKFTQDRNVLHILNMRKAKICIKKGKGCPFDITVFYFNFNQSK